jgi:hypothetical protein
LPTGSCAGRLAFVVARRLDRVSCLGFRGTRCGILGGPAAWREPLAAVGQLVREHTPDRAYAYIRRGWSVSEALVRDALKVDRPATAGDSVRAAGVLEGAFAVQLLGDGFTARVDVTRRWRVETLGPGVSLWSHVDVDAWSAAPFIAVPTRSGFGHRDAVRSRVY